MAMHGWGTRKRIVRADTSRPDSDWADWADEADELGRLGPTWADDDASSSIDGGTRRDMDSESESEAAPPLSLKPVKRAGFEDFRDDIVELIIRVKLSDGRRGLTVAEIANDNNRRWSLQMIEFVVDACVADGTLVRRGNLLSVGRRQPSTANAVRSATATVKIATVDAMVCSTTYRRISQAR